MKILVIGAGGREDALCQKFLQEASTEVFCAPGNPGMLRHGVKLVPILENEIKSLLAFAKKEAIDLTFVGPEAPLLAGIVDAFEQEDLKIFGPSQAAAMIEGSKDFAKQLMKKYQIPTANFQTFTDFSEALLFCEVQTYPLVLKADGLAAGKGVVIAKDFAEAKTALFQMMVAKNLGTSGKKVVIEEFLEGEEFSLMALVKGEKVYPFIPAQDHKRAYTGDLGPNTGGMGAYAPVKQITKEDLTEAFHKVLKPIAKALVEEGRSFTGVLYAGLIKTKKGIQVIEFNARLGDPETQVLLPQLKNPLGETLIKLLNGEELALEFLKDQVTLGVVVAAKGYPGVYEKGMLLPDFHAFSELNIDYAGVKESQGSLVGAGGRLYCVVATDKSVKGAQEKIYQALEKVASPGTFYRKDIGYLSR